jgi:hypothetical protein
MRVHGFEKRIERAELAAKAKSKHSAECICFPENEPPFFGTPLELKIAAKLKCPSHGDRFPPQFFVYVSEDFSVRTNSKISFRSPLITLSVLLTEFGICLTSVLIWRAVRAPSKT